jgi:hypothetical protein
VSSASRSTPFADWRPRHPPWALGHGGNRATRPLFAEAPVGRHPDGAPAALPSERELGARRTRAPYQRSNKCLRPRRVSTAALSGKPSLRPGMKGRSPARRSDARSFLAKLLASASPDARRRGPRPRSIAHHADRAADLERGVVQARGQRSGDIPGRGDLAPSAQSREDSGLESTRRRQRGDPPSCRRARAHRCPHTAVSASTGSATDRRPHVVRAPIPVCCRASTQDLRLRLRRAPLREGRRRRRPRRRQRCRQ